MTKEVILSGMRPTGKLHLGHLSVLENWAALQEGNENYYMIADWHTLTTGFSDTLQIRENIKEMALDFLAAGIDPAHSAVFVQSHVKEHAELDLLLSMITPLSWLERVPTFKDQIVQFGKEGKDISTHGFLGYPLLMSADIMVYRGTGVPVGEDQLPHLEFTRELVRRFNHLYETEVFPEPKALLAKIKLLPGTDNRKMSKSYGNDIPLDADAKLIGQRVSQMVTDPARIKKDDLGHPDVCTVYTYHTFYNKEEAADIEERCKAGTIGCVACKKRLSKVLDEFMAPMRERRNALAADPDRLWDILADGEDRARQTASKTLTMVREAMRI
ncbi:MAG TPA: tryptophan--tRNA ligase [Clostridiales bacterium]|nr:tryptophan--tRNA ligase [Clostridiales bacterium]